MAPSEKTVEKIFDKLDTLSGQYGTMSVDLGEVKGDVKVIKSELSRKVEEPQLIREVDKQLGDKMELLRDGEPTGRIELQKPTVTANNTNISVTKDINQLVMLILKIVALLMAGGGGATLFHNM